MENTCEMFFQWPYGEMKLGNKKAEPALIILKEKMLRFVFIGNEGECIFHNDVVLSSVSGIWNRPQREGI